jgi:hypothetical protein
VVTLKIAQAVGKKLAGGAKEPEQAVKTEIAEEKPLPEAEKPPAAPKRLALSARLDLTAGTMGTSIEEASLAFMLGLGWAY